MAKLRSSHVAVLAFPFGTHAAPLLTVTRGLATAAPTTVFSFFNTAQSNSSLFSSSPDDLPANIRIHSVADGVPEGHVITGNVLESIEMFLPAAPANFRRAIVAVEMEVGLKVTCMLTDALFWFVADMATEMKASWVAFWTAGAISLTAHVYTDLIRQTIGVNEVDEKMEETLGFIPGLDKIRVKDTLGLAIGNIDHIYPKTLYQMGLALPRATAVFINSFEELDPTLTETLGSKYVSYLNIGPLALLFSTPQKDTLVHDPHGCLAWIENRSPDSVAYISFGTVMAPPPGELVAIAQGLESSKVPFVWSLTEKNSVHLPEGFLDRTRGQGIVVPWAPQVELLKHESTGAFVTHCGWNSVLESVSGSVPMICRPFYGDQRMNGRAVEDVWEIGTIITNGVFTKEGFEKCLDRVFVQDDGKKMRSNVKKLKEQAQEAVSSEGSSFKNFKLLLDQVVNNGE